MKKILSLVTTLVMSATFMTGCGSSDTSSSSKSSTELTTTASGTEAKKTTAKPKKTTEPTTEATTEPTTEPQKQIQPGKQCESKNIIDGIYLGMTKDEVLGLLGEYDGVGNSYFFTSDFDYSVLSEYSYIIDNIELFDISEPGIFSVAFNDSNLLQRYRFTIGSHTTEDFTKDDVSPCLEKVIKGLTEKFGDADGPVEHADIIGYMDSKIWSQDRTGIGNIEVVGGIDLYKIEENDKGTTMVDITVESGDIEFIKNIQKDDDPNKFASRSEILNYKISQEDEERAYNAAFPDLNKSITISDALKEVVFSSYKDFNIDDFDKTNGYYRYYVCFKSDAYYPNKEWKQNKTVADDSSKLRFYVTYKDNKFYSCEVFPEDKEGGLYKAIMEIVGKEDSSSSSSSSVSAEDEQRVKNALMFTSFPTADRTISMLDVLDETFKKYDLDIDIRSSNSSMGYYEYYVTASGDYYANTSAKHSGSTTKGSIHFEIVYVMNERKTCIVSVDDTWGDVYNAIVNIIFGN